MREFIIPDGFVLDEKTASKTFGRFTVSPFERGFGYTLGNSLRRILLSSIPGCAVSALKVEGAMHEFETVFGVKEDVSEIVLNFKKLCFTMKGDERVLLNLNTSKKGEVRGRDIELVSGVKLSNPDEYLFTLDKPKKMNIEIEVTKGIGFVPVESRTEPLDVGFIAVDANYSPVKKVAYFVRNTRVKRITNYDELVLEITTDGTVAPVDALKKSAEILRKCAGVFLEESLPAEEEEKSSAKEKDVQDQSIEVLEVSTRILNTLKGKKIHTIKDLISCTAKKLETFPNLGKKSLDELRQALKQFSKREGVEVALKDEKTEG